MVKNKISFAYAANILPGMDVYQQFLPQIWWKNINSSQEHIIALTIGVIIDKDKNVQVSVDLKHESSDESCIVEENKLASQADHFLGFPVDRQEFIGVSTLHVGGVKIKKTGMYTLTIKLMETFDVLDEVETSFFVESLTEQSNG